MNTITTPNFMGSIAKIIEEIRTQACIDAVDAEVIEKILQEELNEYCQMLDGYYWVEYHNKYCNEISSVRNGAYEAGYAEGYDDGYAKSHYAV